MPEMSLQTLIWLFIVIFLLHDLEEIIWVESWIKKNKQHVMNVVPTSIKRRLDKMLTITSGQFALAVLLEFIIFIPFTYLAAEKGVYLIYLSMNTIFLLHVFTHVGQSLYLRMYTPGVVSAVIFVLPYTLYVLHSLLAKELVTWEEILLSIPIGLFIIPIVLVGHELGKKLVR